MRPILDRPAFAGVMTRESVRRARLRVILLVVLGITLGLAGCGDGEAAAPTTTTQVGATSPIEVELAELLQAPTRFDNRYVRTGGTVDQIAPFALALSSGVGRTSSSPTTTSPTSGAQRLLVFFAGTEVPREGTRATVTGTVQDTFDVAAIERTLGITLDRTVIAGLGLGSDDTVLLAETIRSANGTSTPTDTMTGAETGTTPATKATTGTS